MALIALKSMHNRAVPSGFLTVTIGEAQLLLFSLFPQVPFPHFLIEPVGIVGSLADGRMQIRLYLELD